MSAAAAVGARMMRQRQLLGMTQGAFAALVGVGQPQVSRWERGDVVVPFARRAEVAMALRMSPAALFREVLHAEMVAEVVA